MDLLQRSGSRLLFVTSELFDEGKIDEQHKRLLKCKYKSLKTPNDLLILLTLYFLGTSKNTAQRLEPVTSS